MVGGKTVAVRQGAGPRVCIHKNDLVKERAPNLYILIHVSSLHEIYSLNAFLSRVLGTSKKDFLLE